MIAITTNSSTSVKPFRLRFGLGCLDASIEGPVKLPEQCMAYNLELDRGEGYQIYDRHFPKMCQQKVV